MVSHWYEARGTTVTGRLELWPHDTLHRYYVPRFGDWQYGARRWGGDRPLMGVADIDLKPLSVGVNGDLRSRDPDRPGAELTAGTGNGDAEGVIALGPSRNTVDGQGTWLVIERVSPAGFWGRWASHHGYLRPLGPDGQSRETPTGHFCAVRELAD